MTTGTAPPQGAQSVESAVRDASWIAPGLRSGDGMAWLDREPRPIDGLTAAGLGWLVPYVEPLQGVIDRMRGSASVIRSFADAWQRVATTLDQAGDGLGRASTAETSSWHGESADLYRTWASSTAGTVAEGASLARATGEAARLMGDAVGNARKNVTDLVTHLVESLVSGVSLAVAAEGGVTPAVINQATSLVESYRTPVAAVERSLVETMNNLRPHLVAGGGGPVVRGVVQEDSGFILAGLRGGGGRRTKSGGGGQGQPGTGGGGDAESWWQKLWPWRKPKQKPDGRPKRTGRDPHDDLSKAERDGLRDKLMDEYKGSKDPQKWVSQTNAEDALKGGPAGSKIDVGGAGADIKWKGPDGTVVAGREVKVIEGDNLSTLNGRLSDARTQLKDVQGTKEVWVQVPPDSGVGADKLPKMMSDWRNGPWGRTPEQWRTYEGIDVTFRDPAGKVLGRFDAGTGLPKP